MIDLISKRVAILHCADPGMVGLTGTFAIESMKTITIVSGSTKRVVPKLGTVLRVEDGGRVIVVDEMAGRVEDRLARGAKV
jgi:RNase P/RNase MRP subunit p29